MLGGVPDANNSQRIMMITILFLEDLLKADLWNLPGDWVNMMRVVNGMDFGYG